MTLQVENRIPAASGSSNKQYFLFDLVDSDLDYQPGILVPESINVEVKTTGNYFGVIVAGEVDSDIPAYIVWDPENLTGNLLTNQSITGRWRKRFTVKYTFHQNLPDGQKIYIHLTASDVNGNTIDNIWWIQLASWVYTNLPKVSIEYNSDEITTIYIPHLVLGENISTTVNIWWGKDCNPYTYPLDLEGIRFLIDHVYISLINVDSNSEGLEILGSGGSAGNSCITINGVPVIEDQQVDLGAFEVGDYVPVTFTVSTQSGMATTYPVAISIDFDLAITALTGKGITGTSLTGDSVEIGNRFGLQNKGFILFINIISDTVNSYLSEHGITWTS